MKLTEKEMWKIIKSDCKAAGWKGDYRKIDASTYAGHAAFVMETRYGYPHDLFFDDLRRVFNEPK